MQNIINLNKNGNPAALKDKNNDSSQTTMFKNFKKKNCNLNLNRKS